MDERDFIERCNMGLDIEIEYAGTGYALMLWPDGLIRIYEYDKPDTEKAFASADALLDQFLVNGIPLRTALPNVAHML